MTYIVNAEKRNKNVKAKKIRKSGQVPCSVYGETAADYLLVTISEKEARKLLRTKFKGGLVTLNCGEENIKTIIRELTYNSLTNQIEEFSFQRLYDGKVTSGSAKITLLNKEMIPTMVQQLLPEISYKALPEHIVETIEIDLGKLSRGDQIKVGDLPISNNPDIEVLPEKEQLVLKIAI